jgi:hypothetical protein
MSKRLFTKNNLFGCIGLTGVYCFMFQECEREKLISVQLITRHGARTPLKKIPGIEEVKFLSITSFIYKLFFFI